MAVQQSSAGGTARRLLVGLIASVALAIGALGLARYLSGPRWIDALWACSALTGLAVALALAVTLVRLAPAAWRIASALALALSSAATRWHVLEAIGAQGVAQPRIDLLQIWLAASSVVWGAVALLWAVGAVSDALENPVYSRFTSLARLAGAVLAVSLALYSLAPLWMLLGLRLNAWTVLGLLGLALLAYLIDLMQRRAARWLGRLQEPRP